MKVSKSLVKDGMIQTLMSEADMYNFGLDHLRINLSSSKLDFMHKINKTIDPDNSSEYFHDVGEYKFSITKDLTSKGVGLNVSISIDNISNRVFQYFIFNEKNQKQRKTTGGFTVYSTYFRLVELGKVPPNLLDMFIGDNLKFHTNNISRVDFKIDLFYRQPKLIIPYDKIINPRKGIENVSYKKGDIQNGWIYGKAKSKSLVIRMYEKKIDTLAKGKIHLYKDYFEYINVFRLEFEFLNKFMFYKGKPFTFSELHLLEEKVYGYVGLTDRFSNENYFHQYKKSDYEITEDDYKYINDATGRTLKLMKCGINPFIKTIERCEREGIDKLTIIDHATRFNEYCTRNSYINLDNHDRPGKSKTILREEI